MRWLGYASLARRLSVARLSLWMAGKSWWARASHYQRRTGMQTAVHSMAGHKGPCAGYQARNFLWEVSGDGKVATVTLNRPERKNPLTFDSYAELRDLFRSLIYATDIKAVVVIGAGANFCSGGDVHELIGRLTRMTMPELLDFTRMTCDLLKALRACTQPIVPAVDGICAGAGVMLALA